MSPRTTARRWAVPCALALSMLACNPDDPTQLLPCTGNQCTNEGAKSPVTVPNPARTSWQEIEPGLFNACAGCHDLGGPSDRPFLAGPDRYHSFVSWPGIVTPVPEQSKLLTHSMNGKGHIGKNLDAPDLVNTLFPKIKSWLAEEATSLTPPPEDIGPHVEARAPIFGHNAFYLDPLGDKFQGMAVTFTANLMPPGLLDLTLIEVHPTGQMGVRIKRPVIVVYALGKDADPMELSDIEQTFEAGTYGKLGPGTLTIPWPEDAKVSVAFESIEAVPPVTPNSAGSCKDLTAFKDHVAGQVGKCLDCHGGARPQAVAAVDMTGLVKGDPISLANACGQIKNRVEPMAPASSVLFLTTDPGGNAVHEYKFLGSAQLFQSFRESVSKWIEAEK